MTNNDSDIRSIHLPLTEFDQLNFENVIIVYVQRAHTDGSKILLRQAVLYTQTNNEIVRYYLDADDLAAAHSIGEELFTRLNNYYSIALPYDWLFIRGDIWLNNQNFITSSFEIGKNVYSTNIFQEKPILSMIVHTIEELKNKRDQNTFLFSAPYLLNCERIDRQITTYYGTIGSIDFRKNLSFHLRPFDHFLNAQRADDEMIDFINKVDIHEIINSNEQRFKNIPEAEYKHTFLRHLYPHRDEWEVARFYMELKENKISCNATLWEDARWHIKYLNHEVDDTNYSGKDFDHGRNALNMFRAKYLLNHIPPQARNHEFDFFRAMDFAKSAGKLDIVLEETIGERDLTKKFSKLEVKHINLERLLKLNQTGGLSSIFEYPCIVNFSDEARRQVIDWMLTGRAEQNLYFYTCFLSNYIDGVASRTAFGAGHMAELTPALLYIIRHTNNFQLLFTAADLVNTIWVNINDKNEERWFQEQIYAAVWPRLGDNWPLLHQSEIRYRDDEEDKIKTELTSWIYSTRYALMRHNPKLHQALQQIAETAEIVKVDNIAFKYLLVNYLYRDPTLSLKKIFTDMKATFNPEEAIYIMSSEFLPNRKRLNEFIELFAPKGKWQDYAAYTYDNAIHNTTGEVRMRAIQLFDKDLETLNGKNSEHIIEIFDIFLNACIYADSPEQLDALEHLGQHILMLETPADLIPKHVEKIKQALKLAQTRVADLAIMQSDLTQNLRKSLTASK